MTTNLCFNTLLTAAAMLVSSCVTAVAYGEQTDHSSRPTIGVCLIPELGYIPELHSWSVYEQDVVAREDVRKFEQAWETTWRKKVAAVLTPEIVRQMVMPRDRYGMSEYKRISSLENITWKPVTMHRTKSVTYVVFEGTADTLPRITAILRWLKVYCLYDAKRGTISRVTLTVRGERDE